MIAWFKKWAKYIQILRGGRPVVEEAIRQGELVKDSKNKHTLKSTEFWVSIFAAVGAVTAQAMGVLPEPWGAICAAVSTCGYAISRGIAKSGDALGGAKPGLATTEFWASLATAIAQCLAAVAGVTKPETAAILAAASAGCYEVSRGLAKGGKTPDPE